MMEDSEETPRYSACAFSEIAVSAPSKIIIHGEHSVVYGKTALAGSLDLRTRMIIKPNSRGNITVDFPDILSKQSWSIEEVQENIFDKRPSPLITTRVNPSFLETISNFLRGDDENAVISSICFFYLYATICQEAIPMDIVVESEIPIGAGLGSSAALSVCLAAGLLTIKSEIEEDLISIEDPNNYLRDRKICDLAFLSEEILHGSASGKNDALCLVLVLNLTF